MNKKVKPLLIGVCIGLVAGLIWYSNKSDIQEEVQPKETQGVADLLSSDSLSAELQIGKAIIPVELALTQAEQIKGLSGRENLPEDTGLFFVFDVADLHGIWMKDMKFSIDILWISPEDTVVHIEENVSPETYPDVFYPSAPAMAVLEVPAGFVKQSGIALGDVVIVKK